MSQVRKFQNGGNTPAEQQKQVKKSILIDNIAHDIDDEQLDKILGDFGRQYEGKSYLSKKKRLQSEQELNKFYDIIKNELKAGTLSIGTDASGNNVFKMNSVIDPNEYNSDYAYQLGNYLRSNLSPTRKSNDIVEEAPKTTKEKLTFADEFGKDFEGNEDTLRLWDSSKRSQYAKDYYNKYLSNIQKYNQNKDLYDIDTNPLYSEEQITSFLKHLEDSNISDEELSESLNPLYKGGLLRKFINQGLENQPQNTKSDNLDPVISQQNISVPTENTQQLDTINLLKSKFNIGDSTYADILSSGYTFDPNKGIVIKDNSPFSGYESFKGNMSGMEGIYYNGRIITPQELKEYSDNPNSLYERNPELYDYINNYVSEKSIPESSFIESVGENYEGNLIPNLYNRDSSLIPKKYAYDVKTGMFNHPSISGKEIIEIIENNGRVLPFEVMEDNSVYYNTPSKIAIVDPKTGKQTFGKVVNNKGNYSIKTDSGEEVPLGRLNNNVARRENTDELIKNLAKRVSEYNKFGEKGRPQVQIPSMYGGVGRYQVGGSFKPIKLKPKEEAGLSDLFNTSELSGADMADLGSLALEVTGLISSFVPGAGNILATGTGLGSSLAQYGADVARNGLNWKDAGNLGLNAAFDFATLIPGIGTTAKAGKVAKYVKKIAKPLMNVIQGTSAGTMGMSALNKIMSDEEMTIEDWRNLSRALTGAVSIGKNIGSNRLVKPKNTEYNAKYKLKGEDKKLNLSESEYNRFVEMNPKAKKEFIVTKTKGDSDLSSADIKFGNNITDKIGLSRGKTETIKGVDKELKQNVKAKKESGNLNYLERLFLDRQTKFTPEILHMQQGGSFVAKKNPESTGKIKLSDMNISPIVSTMSLINKNRGNKKVLKTLNEMQAPVFTAPQQINYDVKGNPQLQQMYNKYAQDRISASDKNYTSNALANASMQRQAILDANKYKEQGDLANINAIQQSRDKALQLALQNSQQRNQIENQNIQAQNLIDNKKKEFKAQHDLTKMQNLNTYMHDILAQTKDFTNLQANKEMQRGQLDLYKESAKKNLENTLASKEIMSERNRLLSKYNNQESELMKNPSDYSRYLQLEKQMNQLSLNSNIEQIENQRKLIDKPVFRLYKIGGKI